MGIVVRECRRARERGSISLCWNRVSLTYQILVLVAARVVILSQVFLVPPANAPLNHARDTTNGGNIRLVDSSAQEQRDDHGVAGYEGEFGVRRNTGDEGEQRSR